VGRTKWYGGVGTLQNWLWGTESRPWGGFRGEGRSDSYASNCAWLSSRIFYRNYTL